MSKTPDRKKANQKRYLEGCKMVSFALSRKNDKDIISWLEMQENQSEAIREALREVRI